MSYNYSLNDELISFYQVNRPYLTFLYKTEDDFMDEFLEWLSHDHKQNIENMTNYDILQTNIKMSQNKFTKNEDKNVLYIMKKMHDTNNMKHYDKLDRELKKINKDIQRKRKFIKMFFMELEI